MAFITCTHLSFDVLVCLCVFCILVFWVLFILFEIWRGFCYLCWYSFRFLFLCCYAVVHDLVWTCWFCFVVLVVCISVFLQVCLLLGLFTLLFSLL